MCIGLLMLVLRVQAAMSWNVSLLYDDLSQQLFASTEQLLKAIFDFMSH